MFRLLCLSASKFGRILCDSDLCTPEECFTSMLSLRPAASFAALAICGLSSINIPFLTQPVIYAFASSRMVLQIASHSISISWKPSRFFSKPPGCLSGHISYCTIRQGSSPDDQEPDYLPVSQVSHLCCIAGGRWTPEATTFGVTTSLVRRAHRPWPSHIAQAHYSL
jgi:hypothetical protein